MTKPFRASRPFDTRLASGALAALALAATGAPAVAADVVGSGAVVTNRLCSAANTSCTLQGTPGFTDGDVRLDAHQYFGGYGQGLSANPTLSAGAAAEAQVTFSDDYLPIVRLSSDSGAETRTGASATTFRSFTYNGDVAIDLAIQGDLHFFTSGDQVANVGQAFPGDEFAGDGTLNVVLALVRMDVILNAFQPGATGRSIVSNVGTSFPGCGEEGVIASSGFNSGGFGGGEYNQIVSLSQSCGGGAILINPGDSFVVIATLQSISNRNGFINAMNTFRVEYDEENTFLAGTSEGVGEGFLTANVAPGAQVPEPATWALMIGGFGIAGSLLRRRRGALA
jgi:hypothetical protein